MNARSFVVFCLAGALGLSAPGQDPIEVDAVPAVAGPWPEAVRMASTVEPIDLVMLRPALDGQVEQVLVEVGDAVEKGQVLATLRAPTLDIDVALARAAMDRARTDLELARQRVVGAELAGRAAQVALESVEAEHERTRRRQEIALANLERVEAQVEEGRLPSAALDQARLEVTEVQTQGRLFANRIAAAKVEAERVQQAVVEAQLGVRAAETAVATAELGVERAEVARDACQIRAPFSGTVTQRHVAAGDTVRAHESAMLQLVDLDRVRIRILVPRHEIDQASLGSKVWIRRDPYSLDAEESAITHLSVSVQRIEKAVFREATVEFQNADRRWLLGDECSVWLLPERGPGASATMVPASAVVEVEGRAYVYEVKVGRGGAQARRRSVILGRRDGGDVEILQGIGQEDTVVDAPTEALGEQAVVKIAGG